MYIEEAEKLVQKYETRNPEIIAKEMGINVLYLPYKSLYGITSCLGNYRFIGVNSRLKANIRKLVTAHELCHFVLHPQECGFYFVLSQTLYYNKFEYQANLFAVSLCVGEKIARSEMIKELAARNIEDISKIL